MPEAEAGSILEAKDKLDNVLPTPPEQQTQASSAQALKKRLDWGEPALTIVDARDRDSYLTERIMGAVPMYSDDTHTRITDSLSLRREIYVYGENDDQTAEAANKLRENGFGSVSQLRGGLAGWKAIYGPSEGREG